MKCRRPYVRGKIAFPCGQCMPCRINNRRMWTHRIMLETLDHEYNAFITLSYDDEHLPRLPDGRGNLLKSDYKNWLKRFRKALEPQLIRYYIVGEYGDESNRPHFHAIIFGYQSCLWGQSRYSKSIRNCCPQCDLVRDTWGKGMIYCGEVSTESAQYCAGYTTKKMTAKDDPRLDGRNPEFAQPSLRPHGIGAGMMHEVASSLLTFNLEELQIDVPSTLRHGSRIFPLGRYLKRKLREYVGKSPDAPEAVIKEIEEQLSPLSSLADDIAFNNQGKTTYAKEFQKLLLRAGDQAVKNLEAKQKIQRKRGHL